MSTTESSPDIPTRGPARPAPYVISAVLLAIAIIVPLIVPLYAKASPSFIGMPFFYWYQMLWVLIDTALLAICYQIIKREDRRRREDVRGTGIGTGPARAAGKRPQR